MEKRASVGGGVCGIGEKFCLLSQMMRNAVACKPQRVVNELERARDKLCA